MNAPRTTEGQPTVEALAAASALCKSYQMSWSESDLYAPSDNTLAEIIDQATGLPALIAELATLREANATANALIGEAANESGEIIERLTARQAAFEAALRDLTEIVGVTRKPGAKSDREALEEVAARLLRVRTSEPATDTRTPAFEACVEALREATQPGGLGRHDYEAWLPKARAALALADETTRKEP